MTQPNIVYNAGIPPEFFDFIVVDECHRSIYELWSQVLLYFDAFMVGLTATPAGEGHKLLGKRERTRNKGMIPAGSSTEVTNSTSG